VQGADEDQVVGGEGDGNGLHDVLVPKPAGRLAGQRGGKRDCPGDLMLQIVGWR